MALKRDVRDRGVRVLTIVMLTIVVGLSSLLLLLDPAPPQASATTGGLSTTSGYLLAASNGSVFSYGGAGFFGSAGNLALNKPVVGMAASPDGRGYWLLASDGGVFTYGDAGFYGSTGNLILNKPVVGMAATPDGRGYWFVASDGGIFAYGDAGFYGSTGNLTLNKPVVGIAATPDGRGYWLVASDGGMFAFGDAGFYGSTGDLILNKPVVGMAATPDGRGYWFVASDGGIFAFGDAGFFGSAGNLTLNKPVAGMAATPDGQGYWFVASDGGVFAFGDAGFFGSVDQADDPVVGITTASALTTGSTSTAGIPPTPAGDRLVFGANFATATSIPSQIHEYAGAPAEARTTQWNPSHVVLHNGVLSLETYRDPAHAGLGGPWVSGGIAVWPSIQDVTYGLTCLRSRVTNPNGVTQVELLWPNDGQWPPEVDFNESDGTNSSGGHLFYGPMSRPNSVQVGPSGVDLTQWHDWCVDVQPTNVTWTVDGAIWASTSGATPYALTPFHLAVQQEVWPCGNAFETCPSSQTPAETDLDIAWIAEYASN